MKRELTYQFDLDIERVHLIINMKCDVQVWWKSGKRKIATKNSLKLAGTEKYFDVREKLSIIAKIVIENGVIQEKKTQLLIILFISQNTSKLGGRVYLNLAQFISPDALTMPVVKRYERSLENCPDEASKIVFNLSCKYIQENFGGSGSENLHDISFQANTFSNNFGTASSYGRSTNDMTFRPQKQQPGYKWPQGSRQEHSPKQKRRNENERDWQKQKMDTPSWDRTSNRDRQYENPPNVSGRTREREMERPPQQVQQVSQPQQRPLQFSFSPLTPADRQKMGLDNSQIIKDLKQIVEQRGRTIKSLQEEISRLRSENEQKSQKSSMKSLSLLNELNSTTVQKEQLQRQKSQIQLQMEQLRDQNKKLEEKCRAIHFQYSQANNQYANKLDQRKKMIEQLNNKLQECDRRANKFQDELFRKQNEIITKEKQFIAAQASKDNVIKQQKEKLMTVSVAIKDFKDLQGNFEKLFAQKQDLRNKLEEMIYKVEKSDENSYKISQNCTKLQQELQRQREKSKLIETKYKQRESILQEIQTEFKAFSVQKGQILKQKDQELASLRQKFNAACKKIDEVSGGEESMKNTISEKNIRIKSLEGICAQLEKTLEQKEELISKAKEYISRKQQELESKSNQIEKKDQFIQKCRAYIETRDKQYNQLVNGMKNNTNSETMSLKKQIKQKQTMLQEYINERHRADRQIDDMAKVIDRLKLRVMECEDHMDELQRKNQSQEGTLKDLVKKNLDMEIQLNIKDYEIQSLKSSR